MHTTPSETPAGSPTGPATESIRASVALALIALGLGLAVEILFYGHQPGISFFLWAGLCVGAALIAARLERVPISASAWLVMIPVLFFAAVVFLRQEPLTVFLSVALTLFLLALMVRVFRFGRLGRFGWVDMAVAFLWVPIEAWIRPWPVAGEAWGRTVKERGNRRIGFSILRGVLLALPVLAVFLALLSAADLVFGDYVERALAWLDLATLADWVARAVVVLVSAVFLLGALVAALRLPGERRLIGEDPPLLQPFLGFTETVIVLSLTVMTFAAFVAVQFTYLFGGRANIHAAGYTFSNTPAAASVSWWPWRFSRWGWSMSWRWSPAWSRGASARYSSACARPSSCWWASCCSRPISACCSMSRPTASAG
jgi:hypothetical protein